MTLAMPRSVACARAACRLARPVRLLTLALVVLVALAAIAPSIHAFECSACQYTARNCSALESESTAVADATVTASDSVAVCDATGKIQIDDVFCDNDECQCAGDKRCASLVVGCANVFQARSRKRCIGRDAEQWRFQKCAIAQGLTTLNATGLSADWVYFKDPAQCVSRDCAAVHQFHASGIVQCGLLVVAWKDSDAALFHFIVDGSRARDMAPGVFHYAVPIDSTGALVTANVRETRVESCYALQTRNDKSASCDGYYIQYDTAVQLSHSSDDYQLSKLNWPIWLAVVGSVMAATIAVAGVALAAYRFRRMDLGDGADDELLQQQLDAADTDTMLNKKASASTKAASQDLRLRTLSPRSSDDDEVSISANSV